MPPHLHGRLPWSSSRAARPAKAAAELSEPNASPWSCCRPRYRPAALNARPPGLQAYYAPRQEVCPGEPVLLQRQEHGRLQVGLALWGLLPEWAKDPAEARRPVSARSETVNEKVSFRGAWRHRRCLLPADAFFEWGGAPKRPHRFARRDGAPFWIGGIWER